MHHRKTNVRRLSPRSHSQCSLSCWRARRLLRATPAQSRPDRRSIAARPASWPPAPGSAAPVSTPAGCAAGASGATARSATATRMTSATTRRRRSVGPVDLGAGRTARAIAAGFYHACAILDKGQVRCWGAGYYGALGYGNTSSIGDNETPGSVGPVDLGAGRTAVAITAGGYHTCAILDNGRVRCWGYGASRPARLRQHADDRRQRDAGLGRARSTSARDERRWRSPPADTTPARSSTTARCAAGARAGRASSATGTQKDIGDNETPGLGPAR